PQKNQKPAPTPIVFERTSAKKVIQKSEKKEVESLTTEILTQEKITKKEELNIDEAKPEPKPEPKPEIVSDEKMQGKEKSKSEEKKSFVSELIKDSNDENKDKIFTIEDTQCIYDDKARSILESERLDEI
ncbi:MAG: hypothetical protein QXT63_09580, partial [Thermoplasmata archaeon]